MAAQKSHDYRNTSRMFGANGCRYAMSSLRYEILYSCKARINTSISVSSDILTPPTHCMFEYGDQCPHACPTPWKPATVALSDSSPVVPGIFPFALVLTRSNFPRAWWWGPPRAWRCNVATCKYCDHQQQINEQRAEIRRSKRMAT